MKTTTYHSHKCVLGREAEAAEPHRQSRGGVAARPASGCWSASTTVESQRHSFDTGSSFVFLTSRPDPEDPSYLYKLFHKLGFKILQPTVRGLV
jgi:hypothetical protein